METVPPPAWTDPPAMLNPAASMAKFRSRAVASAPMSRLSTVSLWFGAVMMAGLRLVNSISPRAPLTGPAGLTKSRPGTLNRPLDVGSPSLVQSNRPSNPTTPVAGDWTKASTRGLSIEG